MTELSEKSESVILIKDVSEAKTPPPIIATHFIKLSFSKVAIESP